LGLSRLTRDLAGTFEYTLENRRAGLADQNRALRQLSPLVRVRSYRQRIDDWQSRMTSTQRGRFGLLRERVESREKSLVASSPQAILERGYALVTDAATGQRIKSAHAAPDQIAVQFHDGTIQAKVDHD
jgi:exodeoxyribonuclease VII large subunit